MESAIMVVTTTAPEEVAQNLAKLIVEARLAACVQVVGPVQSIYRWQGKIESSAEWQCLCKTTIACYEPLEQWLLQHHPYQTPEILAFPVVQGSVAYLNWLTEEVQPAK